MGVKDLWKLLEPAGRPVKLESLEGLVVGVDISIWLNQAVKGVRDRHGEPVPYAHLIVLFNRICKLLHYHIKPVFVFDGATPQLKQMTLASRSKRRDVASQRSLRAADKRASKLLQAKILEHLTGKKSSINVAAASPGQSDMFQLPPIPEGALSKKKSPTFEEPSTATQSANGVYYSDVATVDVHSKEFDSLPPEVQHELLLERQQIEKYSYHDPGTLPQVANDFSSYQLSRLMRRSRISQKLEGVRKVLKSNDTAVIGLGEESKVHEVETSRIMSSEASHYILVKGMDIESQSSQDEEDDSQSQASSVDVKISTGGGTTYTSSLDIGISTGAEGGTQHTATREDIEYEVRRFFRDRETEDENEQSKSGLEIVGECAATGGKHDAVVMGLESSGEEEMEGRNNQEKAGGTTRLLTKDDVIAQVVEQDEKRLTPITNVTERVIGSPFDSLSKETHGDEVAVGGEVVCTQAHLSHNSASKGERESSLSATSKFNSVVLPTPTTANLILSTEDKKTEVAKRDLLSCNDAAAQEKAVEHDSLLHADTAAKEKSEEASPCHSEIALDLTGAHNFTQEQPRLIASSPPKQIALKGTECDLLHPTHSSEVALIESDEGGSPSSPAAAWSGGQEVEALLTVAPSEAQEQLSVEVEQLERERTRQSRAAATVSNQMYKEAQELLSLFGLPYLVAPTEAEAQCAALNEQELTQGTITDDNDVFLFGGRRVYRHFFSQDREVELYTSSELQQRLGLSRDYLIVLAYLLGSDYTEGLEGIGIVMAMEALRDFPGTGLEPLIKLREWHGRVAHKSVIVSKGSALQKKLCQFPLPAGFPNAAVRDSYLHPEIDDSSEQFEWGKPDLDLIRRFASEKMGWSQEKVDEILLPVLKRMNTRESQTQKKITQFMPSLPSSSSSSSPTKQRRIIKSRRIRNVVARLTTENEDEYVPKTRSHPAKRTRGAQNTRKRQPAAKRQKKNSATFGSDSSKLGGSFSEVSQPVLTGPNLSASSTSSSSSEDEFDSLVKNWNEEISIEDGIAKTKGHRTTKSK